MLSFAKIYIFFLLLPAYSLHAMEAKAAESSTPAAEAQMSPAEKAQIVDCVKQARFALRNPEFFRGPEHMAPVIMGNVFTIQEILKKYGISYPAKPTVEWFEELTKKYGTQPKWLPRPSSQEKIEIAADAQAPALLGMSEHGKETIKQAIRNIESTVSLAPDEERAAFLRSQCLLIEGTLNVWLVRHPQEKTMAWLAELKVQLGEKRSEKVVDIAGLPKLAVVKALYFKARGRSLWHLGVTMTDDQLTRIIQDGLNIDYIGDRSLKVDLSEDSFDCELFDRDNGGTGTAQAAITELRKSICISK